MLEWKDVIRYEVDVVVIGGGFVGLMVVIYVVDVGVSVIFIDE